MQKKLRRFILIGAIIFFGIVTVAGSVFWFAMNNTSADAMSQGMAHYNKEEYVEAAQWFRKAAEQGHAQAQYHLGHMYDSGKGVTEDNQQAIQWYRKAVEQGLAQAQLQLGGMYQRGVGVSRDEQEALKWYRKAAEQGYAPAQDLLGMIYQLGVGVTQDDQQAVNWYRQAAEQGHAKAQYHLGQSYYNGKGVTKDEPEAIKWLSKAAAQGQPDAQEHALAVHFVAIAPSDNRGDGGTRPNPSQMADKDEVSQADEPKEVVHKVPEPASQPTQVPTVLSTKPDDEETNTDKPQKTVLQSRQEAAEQGDAQAQFNLGVMYDRGTGVTKDEQQALKWIRKAAEQEQAQAQDHLGMMYYKSVTLDDQEAVKWFRKAAEQGLAQAQLHLGMMYQLGEGITEDDQQAVKWFRKAAEQGDVSAQKLLTAMNGQATVNHQTPQPQLQSEPKRVIAQNRSGTQNDASETVVENKVKTESLVTRGDDSDRGVIDKQPEKTEVPVTKSGEREVEDKPAKKSSCPDNQYALTVNATPPTSRIRVMNIGPKYQPGLCLTPRRYDIYVTHRGYHGYRKWIAIEEADVSLDVALTPR